MAGIVDDFEAEFFEALRGVRITFDRGRIACPACSASYDEECRADCRLHGLSRVLEPCDDCDGDARLCNCFMRYDPALPPHAACDAQGCDGCKGTGRVQPGKGDAR
jgi:hypothetical protein